MVLAAFVATTRFCIVFLGEIDLSQSSMSNSVRNEDCLSDKPLVIISIDRPAFSYSFARSNRWSSKVIKGGLGFLANEWANSFPIFPMPSIVISILELSCLIRGFIQQPRPGKTYCVLSCSVLLGSRSVQMQTDSDYKHIAMFANTWSSIALKKVASR